MEGEFLRNTWEEPCKNNKLIKNPGNLRKSQCRRAHRALKVTGHMVSCWNAGQKASWSEDFQNPMILKSISFFFFKDLFLLFFHWKGGYTERRDREEDLPSDDSLPKWAQRVDTMPIRSQEPLPGLPRGCRFPKQVPKALGRPQLLSQATGRELEGKRGCRD